MTNTIEAQARNIVQDLIDDGYDREQIMAALEDGAFLGTLDLPEDEDEATLIIEEAYEIAKNLEATHE